MNLPHRCQSTIKCIDLDKPPMYTKRLSNLEGYFELTIISPHTKYIFLVLEEYTSNTVETTAKKKKNASKIKNRTYEMKMMVDCSVIVSRCCYYDNTMN